MTSNNEGSRTQIIVAIIGGTAVIIAALIAAIGQYCSQSNATKEIKLLQELGSKGIECTSNGQLCKPRREEQIEVKEDGILYAEYIVPPGHCSTVIIYFYVDNKLKGREEYQIDNYKSVKKDLGFITKGTHTLALEAKGVTGGCNKGELNSWGGEVNIHILPDPPIFCRF